jgi:hypothetical protein
MAAQQQAAALIFTATLLLSWALLAQTVISPRAWLMLFLQLLLHRMHVTTQQ